MAKRIRPRGEDIRRFILRRAGSHPKDLSKVTAAQFGITRQAVHKHLQRLYAEGAITETGNTRNRIYKLCPLVEWQRVYRTEDKPAEDLVWSNDLKKVLGELPENVMAIWHYGFTEMFNNALDHSGGKTIGVRLVKTAAATEVVVMDDGVGIFKKIQAALNLLDERHAILELSKGKLTTDPNHHSGEGIFFTSRMFDSFDILSRGVFFTHEYGKAEDWIMEREAPDGSTIVWMKLHNHTSRTLKKVFNQYSSGPDEYRFNKTVVPVKLARYGNDQLISRSQAKRLLARVELFKVVVFDFKDVPTVGQAVADEIFRVFARKHPQIELLAMHANSEVKRMIERAKSANG